VKQAPAIEEMPRYFQAECEGLATKKEKDDCAGNKLIRYVAENLVYPEAARKDSIEGMVIVQFMVKEDGSMGDVSVVRDIGYGCGEAVIKVLQPLTGRKNIWTPGQDKGKKVSVMQTLPVRFKLN
jgi:protein TonB